MYSYNFDVLHLQQDTLNFPHRSVLDEEEDNQMSSCGCDKEPSSDTMINTVQTIGNCVEEKHS